jgi:hypothetical protein
MATFVETLEMRQLLTSIVVNTTADSALADANIAGPTVTLREAIDYSNANPGNNVISFASNLNGQVISPTIAEPFAITSSVSIVGPAANELAIGFATPVNGNAGLFTVNSGATASFSGLTLEDGGDASDSTSYQAAGIYVAQGNLNVTSCVITGMTGGLGTADANGISAPNGGTIDVTNTTFSDNGGDSYASSIYVAGGATTITGCTFTGNVSQNTIQLQNGTASISSSTFTDNTLEYQEQEIDNGANTTVTNCTFTGNTSYYGAAVGNDGTISISGCTFADNALDTRPNYGFPTIFNYAGTMTVTNTTIDDNVTTQVNDSSLPFSGISGGGIGVNSGSVTVTYCTITGNTASYGGGIQVFGGTLSVAYSIVAGNSASVAGNDIYGIITSLGHNIIGDGNGGSGFVSTDLVGTDASPINPGLGTPGYYGGSTETIPLLVGSPAIGAATPINGITTDQRGVTRSTTAPDIGAFESQVPTLSVSPISFTYGTVLANSQLSGSASAIVNNQTVNVPGVFTFTTASGSLLSAATNQVEAVTFTPNDLIDYRITTTTVTVNVAQAKPTLSITANGGVYNGSPLAATAIVTGINNTSLSGTGVTFAYYLASDTSFKNPSTVAPTSVGSYVVVAVYPAGGNYATVSASKSFSITQANSVLTPAAATVACGGSTLLSTTLQTTAGAPLVGRTVTFSVNGKVVGTGITNASGVATLSVSVAGITPGTYGSGISVSFAGDSNAKATTATASLIIQDAPIAVKGCSLSAGCIALTLGTFTQARTGACASDYVATVNWGDGSAPQQVLIIPDLFHPGQFDIVGLHIYSGFCKSYSVTVTLSTVAKFGAAAGATTSFTSTIVA